MRSIFFATTLGLLLVPTHAKAAWPGDPHSFLSVCSNSETQVRPRMAMVGGGSVVIAWQDWRNGGDNRDVYAVRLTDAGEVAPGWAIDGIPICSASANQEPFAVVADGAGGAIILWRDQRRFSGWGAEFADLYAQRVTASGEIAAGWPADGAPVWLLQGDQFPCDRTNTLQAIPDGRGGAIVVFSGYACPPISFDIMATRITAAGVRAYADTVCSAPNDQEAPVVASDGFAGAIIAWQDHHRPPSSTYDIYAQRVDSLGALLWNPCGNLVGTTTGEQYGPTIVSDATGGAIIAWQDGRSGVDFDIYAQHVMSDGTTAAGWPAEGLPICTAARNQNSPFAVTDDAGGAILVWLDYRNTFPPDRDTFLQRLTSSGSIAPGWPVDGIPLRGPGAGPSAGDAYLRDGAGGIFSIWDGINAIQASRITGTGTISPGWSQNGLTVRYAGVWGETQMALTPGGGAIVCWVEQMQSTGWDIHAVGVHPYGRLASPVDAVSSPAASAWLSIVPNPAHGAVQFIPRAGDSKFKIEVLDLRGRRIWSDVSVAGSPLRWNGSTRSGRRAPAGVYLVRVESRAATVTRRLAWFP